MIHRIEKVEEGPAEGSEMSYGGRLTRLVTKVLLFVKLIAVYLFSIVSFFILDFMLAFGGPDPIGFIVYFITRAGLAVLISSLFFGIQVLNSSKLWIDFVLAMIIFGVPIISFTEAIPFGIVELPYLPPYVSLMQATLTMALLYEFPRLILFFAVKRFLYGKILAEGVR